MSVLSGPMIAECVNRTRMMRKARLEAGAEWPPTSGLLLPLIDIEPFDPDAVGPNSYDLRLDPQLRCYSMFGNPYDPHFCLDMKEPAETYPIDIPDAGYVLQPGRFYLGSTVERTACAGVVPWNDGRSSVGRLGVQIHATAGRGDDGFGMDRDGGSPWTLEITVAHPIRVYAGCRIAQITFMRLEGSRKPYKGKYNHQTGPTPSEMWRDFLPKPRGGG